MKNTLKYLFAMALAAAGTSTYAASGVIELEIPGMNEETAARIVDFRTNACPATVAALRDSIASNYDGVVARKIAKCDELGVKLGDFLMILRVAVTGTKISPPIVGSIKLLGEEETHKRIQKVILICKIKVGDSYGRKSKSISTK